MTNPILQGLGELCCGSVPIRYAPIAQEKRSIYPSDNSSGYAKIKPLTVNDTDAIAAKAVLALVNGDDKPLKEINEKLSRSVVRTTSWTESLAQSVLDHLVEALKSGSPIGDALRSTYELVHDSAIRAFEYAKDHPVFVFLLALGILCFIAPWIIEVLGFTAEGVAAGSWAARWQSTMGGFIDEESLFAWLQSFGALH